MQICMASIYLCEVVLVVLSETLKCEYKCIVAGEDDNILDQGRVSESVLWILSYLHYLYYDLYEIHSSLAEMQRGLESCFICALELSVLYLMFGK
jgi:hypothetical protein